MALDGFTVRDPAPNLSGDQRRQGQARRGDASGLGQALELVIGPSYPPLVSASNADWATSSYRFLRAVLNTAVEDEILVRNPCNIRGASVDRPTQRKTVTERDIWALADAVPDIYRAVVWMAAGTALRTAEIGGLKTA